MGVCSIMRRPRSVRVPVALTRTGQKDKGQNPEPGEVYVPSGTNPESKRLAGGVTGRVWFDPAHPPRADYGLQEYCGGPIDKWSAELRHTFHLKQRPCVEYG